MRIFFPGHVTAFVATMIHPPENSRKLNTIGARYIAGAMDFNVIVHSFVLVPATDTGVVSNAFVRNRGPLTRTE